MCIPCMLDPKLVEYRVKQRLPDGPNALIGLVTFCARRKEPEEDVAYRSAQIGEQPIQIILGLEVLT